VFSPSERERVRARVLELGRSDPRVSGAALTGSGSVGAEDIFSDIDLAFGLAGDVDPAEVLAEWTSALDGELGVLHHFDLLAGRWIYRVFLLPDCLELDLAVAPESEFGAMAATFRLVFGESRSLPRPAPPGPDQLIGLGWHHALHSAAAIGRGRPWLAEHWISALRDHSLALACIRLGLPSAHGRGLDQLDPSLLARYEESLVGTLAPAGLRRSRAAAVELYLGEVRELRPALAAALASAFATLPA
jgi:hypothetical protein